MLTNTFPKIVEEFDEHNFINYKSNGFNAWKRVRSSSREMAYNDFWHLLSYHKDILAMYERWFKALHELAYVEDRAAFGFAMEK